MHQSQTCHQQVSIQKEDVAVTYCNGKVTGDGALTDVHEFRDVHKQHCRRPRRNQNEQEPVELGQVLLNVVNRAKPSATYHTSWSST